MNFFSTSIIAGLLSALTSIVYTPALPHSYTPEKNTPSSSLPTGEGRGGAPLTILFTGDILLDRGVRHEIERHGFHSLFADDSLRSLLKGPLPTGEGRGGAHFVVGNLECPATTVNQPAFKRFVFRSDPQWLDSLRAYGFTHLNLANNHSVDQGRDGLRDTRENILRAGLIPIGADSTMNAAAQPQRLSVPLPTGATGVFRAATGVAAAPQRGANPPFATEGGLRGGAYLLASNRLPLESFAYLPDRESVSQEPLDSLINRVKTIKNADSTAVIVVMLHWGAEHTLQPLPQQRLEAHALIDAGADLLIGHHTHTLQSIETYKGKSIYYSIGNFIFDQQKPLNTEACIVRLRITSDKIAVDTIPIRIDRCAPQIIPRTN